MSFILPAVPNNSGLPALRSLLILAGSPNAINTEIAVSFLGEPLAFLTEELDPDIGFQLNPHILLFPLGGKTQNCRFRC